MLPFVARVSCLFDSRGLLQQLVLALAARTNLTRFFRVEWSMNKYVLRKGCVCSAQLVTLEVDSSPRRVLTAAGSSPALRNLSRLLLVIRISERVVLAPGRIYVSSMGVHASATAESIKPPGWRIKLGQLKGSLLVYEVTMSECDSDPKKADLLWLLPVVRADCSNDLSAKL